MRRLKFSFFNRNFTSLFNNKFILFCLFAFTSAFAQQPVFKNYTVKDELPSSEVYDVNQDSKGFMWFCTDAGVSRYDGYTFHNFSTLNGLSDNTVFGSYEDRKGRIWFRTMSGKLSYFFQDSIYSIEANELISNEMRNGFITSIYIDSGDTIWCGVTIGKGYFKIAPPYKSENFKYVLIDKQCFYVLNINANGYIWGGITIGKNNLARIRKQPSICEYSKTGLTKIISNIPKLIPNSIYLKTNSGDIIVTGEKGIYSLNKKDKFECQGNGFISLYKDKNDGIWSGKSKGGVFFFPKGNLKQTKPSNYLKGESVTGIKEDSEGGFWFTTLENGIYYVASPDLLYYDKANGLIDNKVLTLIEKDSNRIWTGTTNGAICSIEKDTIKNLKTINPTPYENAIYKLYNYPKTDRIIAGAYKSFIFTPGKKYLAEYFINGKDSIAIKCFTIDNQGNIWGGNYLHLLKIDPVKNIVIEEYTSKSRILSLYCDTDNKIWLGCTNGLWSFKDGIFQYYGEKIRLLKNRIEDIQVSSDSTWWLATKGNGVLVKKKNLLFTIDMNNGLSSNICKNIYIDKKGVIWVGTNKGINKIAKNAEGKYIVEVYSSDDGLLSNEINQITIVGNRLWAATNNGIITFDVNKTFINTTPPPVYITSLEINSKARSLSDNSKFKYFENYLKIGFVGLSYKRNTGLKYKFILEGLDSIWHYTENYFLQYTTLPPGSYTFKVFAINNDGVASKVPAEFSFIISRPFWKEWWFIIIVMGIILSLSITGINYRTKILKRRTIEKYEINQKFAELELKALRAQMNPHFIFNSINSIQHFILKNDTDSAHKYLSKFSKLIRNVLENSKHEYITFSEEMQSLELYIELEQLRFSSKFNYSLMIGEGINPENILISPMIIQPYVENAIWHGLMNLKDKDGELIIGIEKRNGLLVCIIDDNGVGRKYSMELKEKSGHKSMGLALTNERVEIMNVLYHSHMKISIIDKLNEDGSSAGTRVEIFLHYV